ncbi:MAG: nucleotide exchange factor GrpE [Ruminococcaceae bacterium]|nr:nucleotide exchange factor GrpE [Oscillospiraceae bacterium]
MTEEKDIQVPETENTAAEPEEIKETPEEPTGASAEETGKKDKKADVKKLKAELEELKKALEAEQQKAAEANDKYLRVCAEYDNFRKRTQKEKENTYAEAVADTVKGLLPVIDNLQYASKYGNADPEKFAEGVKLILDKLPETLEKMHIKSVGAPGETFDPALHNAVMHEESDEHGENEIMDVLQSGYLYEDRVIRYAMVKVAN